MDVRPSPIAGTWYEGNPNSLGKSIDGYLGAVQATVIDGEILAIIVPHAGHRYSGAVAAHAFALLRGLTPDLVAVISPYHQLESHPLIITAHQSYSTPLGTIEVDQDAVERLRKDLDIPLFALHRDREHSLEIELPFLQRVFTNQFKMLPVMIRAQEPEVARKLGLSLARVLKGRNTLMVASTDLSHFYDQATAARLDQEMLARFESFDPESIFAAERTGVGFACGHAAVAAVLWASRQLGGKAVRILNYATSGDITGDNSSVVGYGAAVVTKPI